MSSTATSSRLESRAGRTSALLAFTFLVVCAQAGAQTPSRTAIKVQAVGTFARESFLGGGLAISWRTAARFTAEVNGSVGSQAGELAVRGEALLVFHLDPLRPSGASPYAGGGAAVVARNGARAEYLVLLLGVESRPGRRRGWFAEIGLGGGVRAALGARLGL